MLEQPSATEWAAPGTVRGQSRDVSRRLGAAGLTAVVLAGQSMASLDASIANVAAPAIRSGLRMSAGTLQLALYSYLLVYAAALIPAARLGARAGLGRTFTRGVAIFTASSLACGLAPDAAVLIMARALQGLGAALMVAQVLSLLRLALDGRSRARAMRLYGTVLALGVAVGQVLGGVLVSANAFGSGWRPIFLVNVPVGLAVIGLGAGRLPDGSRTHDAQLDVRGAALLAGGMLALLAPISFGGAAGWPPWCWPTLASGVALLIALIHHLRVHDDDEAAPLIDPTLLRRGGVANELAGVFVLMASYGGLLFTVASYLQSALHETPLRSGLTFAVYACGFATASLTWHRLPARLHARIPGVAFVFFGSSLAALALATSAGWPVYASGLLAVAGAGHGAGFGVIVRRAGERVAPGHASAWSGLLATTTQLAIAAGIACAGTIFSAWGFGVVLISLASALIAAAAATCRPKQASGVSEAAEEAQGPGHNRASASATARR